MRQLLKGAVIAIIAVMTLLQPHVVQAAEKSVTAEIKVNVEGPEGTITVSNWPEEVDPEYKTDGPLPEEASHTFTGEHIFEITFTNVGNYVYKIAQTPTGKQGRNTFDDTYYKYFITVTYDENDNLVYAAEAMTNGSESEKPAEICFKNEAEKKYTVTYLDGDHGKSSGQNESKYKGEYPTGGNVVTPDKGYRFTGRYKYVIELDDGTTITGETDDPTSIEVIGNIIFTPIYEKIEDKPSPTPTSKPGPNNAPYTSDDTNIMMYGGLLVGALLIVGLALWRRRK